MGDKQATEIRCAVEFRADDTGDSPGHLHAVLMRYETRSKSRRETFAKGALVWPEHGIAINTQHDRRSAFMRVMPIDNGDEVVVDTPLPDTAKGRDVASEMRSDQPLYKGMSVEFRVREQRFSGGLRVITKADLVAAALDTSPDYPAPIEVRHEDGRTWPIWL